VCAKAASAHTQCALQQLSRIFKGNATELKDTMKPEWFLACATAPAKLTKYVVDSLHTPYAQQWIPRILRLRSIRFPAYLV